MRAHVCTACGRTKRSHKRNPKVCAQYVMGRMEIREKISSLQHSRAKMYEDEIKVLETLLPKEREEPNVLRVFYLPSDLDILVREAAWKRGLSISEYICEVVAPVLERVRRGELKLVG